MFGADHCDDDIFKNGISLGLFDMKKEEAETYCRVQTQVTDVKHDWHYITGRVHVKKAKQEDTVKFPVFTTECLAALELIKDDIRDQKHVEALHRLKELARNVQLVAEKEASNPNKV